MPKIINAAVSGNRVVLDKDVYTRDQYGIRRKAFAKGDNVPQAEYNAITSKEEVLDAVETKVLPAERETVVAEKVDGEVEGAQAKAQAQAEPVEEVADEPEAEPEKEEAKKEAPKTDNKSKKKGDK